MYGHCVIYEPTSCLLITFKKTLDLGLKIFLVIFCLLLIFFKIDFFQKFRYTIRVSREYAWGRLGPNSHPWGQTFTLNGTQEEVRVLPFIGNSMFNGLFASKLTENAVILRYNFSQSYCHFSLIFLEGVGGSGVQVNPLNPLWICH